MVVSLLAAGVAKLVFVLYKHLGQFLSTENATLRGMGDLNKRNLSLTVNSHILSASITKESSRVFVADPVIFTLEHLDVRLPKHCRAKDTAKAAQPFLLKDKCRALMYCCRKNSIFIMLCSSVSRFTLIIFPLFGSHSSLFFAQFITSDDI